jgi:hypothetical protein
MSQSVLQIMFFYGITMEAFVLKFRWRSVMVTSINLRTKLCVSFTEDVKLYIIIK